jgi:GTP-binding protein Era
MHKSGYVNIIGKPNAGKSTLINALIGEKLSIISPKVQTTRHRILGILSEEDYQIVFSDTPGIIEDPKYLLQEKMMTFVKSALSDADVILLLVEFTDKVENILKLYNDYKAKNIPLLLVINKIDIAKTQEEVVEFMEHFKHIPEEDLIPISATKNFNIQRIVTRSLELLPEQEAFFNKEQYTDKSERFIASEMIREKIFQFYKQEIPYSIEVAILKWEDTETILKIHAEIFVNRASQKPILIGRGGEALKRLGTTVRIDLEKLYEKKVFLDLYVKVRQDWRENKNMLKDFGYDAV